jgi:hypothetical protein
MLRLVDETARTVHALTTELRESGISVHCALAIAPVCPGLAIITLQPTQLQCLYRFIAQ